MTTETMKNKDLKHLLSETEESVDTDRIARKLRKYINERKYATAPHEYPMPVMTWEDVHEVGWQHTSVTEDMRNLNTRRILQDITRQIRETTEPYRAVGGGMTASANQILIDTQERLEGYVRQGAIQGFEIERLDAEPSSVNLNVNVIPAQTLERVSISVQLAP